MQTNIRPDGWADIQAFNAGALTSMHRRGVLGSGKQGRQADGTGVPGPVVELKNMAFSSYDKKGKKTFAQEALAQIQVNTPNWIRPEIRSKARMVSRWSAGSR